MTVVKGKNIKSLFIFRKLKIIHFFIFHCLKNLHNLWKFQLKYQNIGIVWQELKLTERFQLEYILQLFLQLNFHQISKIYIKSKLQAGLMGLSPIIGTATLTPSDRPRLTPRDAYQPHQYPTNPCLYLLTSSNLSQHSFNICLHCQHMQTPSYVYNPLLTPSDACWLFRHL